MKTPCPPLENKGSNALDGPMKDNPGINTEPDMSGSLANPKPNMTKGYSPGDLMNTDPSKVLKDPFSETGVFNDEY